MSSILIKIQASSGPSKPPKGTGRAEVAKSDCSSFLSKLVSLCPAYVLSLRVVTYRLLFH
jgi:hypothetical protein